MSSFEIARRLIDGIWRTGSIEEDAGGNGGGGLPNGWTGDGANPENVAANGGVLDGLATVGASYVSVNQSALIMAFPNDPSTGGGAQAAIGSLFLRTTGELWIKTGEADTDWTRVATV